jgi:hypothetical protein
LLLTCVGIRVVVSNPAATRSTAYTSGSSIGTPETELALCQGDHLAQPGVDDSLSNACKERADLDWAVSGCLGEILVRLGKRCRNGKLPCGWPHPVVLWSSASFRDRCLFADSAPSVATRCTVLFSASGTMKLATVLFGNLVQIIKQQLAHNRLAPRRIVVRRVAKVQRNEEGKYCSRSGLRPM